VGVGGACLGFQGVNEMVFDHHFVRFDIPNSPNFPSTSLTVLYHAMELAKWGQGWSIEEPISLFTRHDPEFDSCLAVYLVQRILEEPDLANGWATKVPDPAFMIQPPGFFGTVPRGKPAFRWRQPEIPLVERDPLDKMRRALLWLALVASHIETNRPIFAPPDRSVDHLFLAAKHRRRFVGPDARVFFQSLEKRIIEEGFQPLYDGVSPDDVEFSSEIRLLDRQRELYRLDLVRSKKAIVFLSSHNPKRVENLTSEQDKEEVARTEATVVEPGKAPSRVVGSTVLTNQRVPVDGLFLRDPQCLFFKWFAREDRLGSSLGEGFRFLAVAQSLNKRIDLQRPNRSRNRFWIDQEWARSKKVHILDLLVMLQEREKSRMESLNPGKASRILGKGSEGGLVPQECWLDLSGREGTFLETPVFGTLLKEGSRSDLSDDEPGYLAWDYLTSKGFEDSQPRQFEFPWISDSPGKRVENTTEILQGGFRFVRIRRKSGVPEVEQGLDSINSQIAERLWEWIQPVGTRGKPDDFAQRHLIHRGEWVAVWNRQGIAIAHADTFETTRFVDRLQGEVEELARLTGEIRNLLHDSPQKESQELRNIEKKLHLGTEALARLAELHLRAQAGQSPVLRPFMEANGIMELASMVESMNRIRIQEKVEAQERRRDDRLQQTIAVASAVAIFFAWLQIERVGLVGGDRSDGVMEGNLRAIGDMIIGAGLACGFLFWAFRRIKRWG